MEFDETISSKEENFVRMLKRSRIYIPLNTMALLVERTNDYHLRCVHVLLHSVDTHESRLHRLFSPKHPGLMIGTKA